MRPELGAWKTRLTITSVLVVLSSFATAAATDPNDSISPVATDDDYVLISDTTISSEVDTLLSDPEYRFCQDPKYRLFAAEKQDICHQLPVFEGRCPKLAAACARPTWEEDMKIDTDESWFDWSFLDFDGRWIAGLFKVIFWAALAIGAFILLRALLRQARRWKEEQELERDNAPAPTAQAKEEALEELRAQVLLQMAREELEKNNVTEALHLTYRATVRSLCDAEWVKPHRSKTSGDYLHQLRKIESAGSTLPVSEVKAHLLALDRERFRAGPRPESARGLLEKAAGLAGQLSQVGVVLLGLWAVGCDLSALPEPPHQPHGPRGRQLFEDLLRARTLSVSRRMERVTEVPEGTSAIIALDASLRKLEWTTVEDWTHQGGHLVVAGPDRVFSSVFELDVQTEPCNAPIVAPELTLVSFGSSHFLQGLDNENPLARCGQQPFATSLSYGQGWITVVADASLFDNVSLAARDNATLALHLAGELGPHVEYLGPWTGQGAHHPLQSIARAGFSWWVAHVLLFGILWAFSRGKRFGTPSDPPEERRRSFSEHARALSLKYEQAGASGWALRNYAEWVVDTLRRRAPSTRGDLKSLSKAVSTNQRDAAHLLQALTTARRADELGETRKSHISTFLRLKSALLGLSEVSRRSKTNKE